MSLVLEQNANLQPLHTLAFAAQARYFARVQNVQQLAQAYQKAQTDKIPLYPLGHGSNLILPEFVNAFVVQWMPKHIRCCAQTSDYVELEVDAGCVWDDLVNFSVQKTWYGLENLAAIPGTVGAAPVQNIGAYGVEFASVVQGVQIFDAQKGELFWLEASACEFAYRHSRFKVAAVQGGLRGHTFIVAVRIRLAKQGQLNFSYADLAQGPDAPKTPAQMAARIRAIRAAKLPDPKILPNVGSFFQNPVICRAQAQSLQAQYPQIPLYATPEPDKVKVAAAWLIETCGLKGWRQGHVGVSPQQALVLVHYGHGRVQELLTLAGLIQQQVKQKFAIELQPEPEYWGT
ncbi:UDP-N-acetylmuramate dehydrogenase [Allopseudospirillum japonicum]|uniref:UDP-N-acetylenolpyruvoylglucosamine reductase n=1 Tax=Allopseudospirillum japonicum TaxID=64971 RepID=A0A1H6S913_9GAMM|nr:UDP-N-acetylmuramate dehydrogenase [Allopseudospirillum japonicum]SEI60205.1 UDP-N-acetylmuramate dehydrogenase [Allopseudospirillum japonicum]